MRAVAVGPLEVVEQRPVEIAGHGYSFVERARHLPEMEVDERPAVLVAHRRDAVLGDQDGQPIAAVGGEEVRQALGIDLPAQLVPLADVLVVLERAQVAHQPGNAQAGVLDEVARVVVETDEVERPRLG